LSAAAFLKFVVLAAHKDLYKSSRRPLGWPGSMRNAMPCFNAVLAVLVFSSVCSSAADASSGKARRNAKPLKHIRLYLETRHDIPERSMEASVGRSSPMKFVVEKLPFLSEIHVERASLVEELGGFQLRIEFNRVGKQLLENYTSAAIHRHLLVMTDIDGDARWIAAPLIRRRIRDGVLVFSPDASRDEMNRLVEGLNREARKREKQWLQ
jgi:hypothetical protein